MKDGRQEVDNCLLEVAVPPQAVLGASNIVPPITPCLCGRCPAERHATPPRFLPTPPASLQNRLCAQPRTIVARSIRIDNHRPCRMEGGSDGRHGWAEVTPRIHRIIMYVQRLYGRLFSANEALHSRPDSRSFQPDSTHLPPPHTTCTELRSVPGRGAHPARSRHAGPAQRVPPLQGVSRQLRVAPHCGHDPRPAIPRRSLASKQAARSCLVSVRRWGARPSPASASTARA